HANGQSGPACRGHICSSAVRPTPARQPHTDLPAIGESEIGRTGGSIWYVVGLRSPGNLVKLTRGLLWSAFRFRATFGEAYFSPRRRRANAQPCPLRRDVRPRVN